MLARHAGLLVEAFGEHKGCQEIRKHIAWYFKGYSVRSHVRLALAHVSTLAELDDLLGVVAEHEPDQVPDLDVLAGPRGRTSRLKRVALPQGWLDSRGSTRPSARRSSTRNCRSAGLTPYSVPPLASGPVDNSRSTRLVHNPALG